MILGTFSMFCVKAENMIHYFEIFSKNHTESSTYHMILIRNIFNIFYGIREHATEFVEHLPYLIQNQNISKQYTRMEN